MSEDQISYSRTARLRAAVASLAADISDSAAGMVTTYADGYAQGGELAEQAARLAADARELLGLAVACERQSGTSWETLAESTGLKSRQATHEKHAAAVKQLDEAITECWLLGDDPRHPGIPEGATGTAETARLLDRWAIRHQADTDPLAHRAADDPAREHPVSIGLKPMDTLEHSSLVIAGARLVSDAHAQAAGWSTDEEFQRARQLELGLARRKVELYERMLAERFAVISHGTDTDTMRDLLAGARARLAELAQAAPPERN